MFINSRNCVCSILHLLTYYSFYVQSRLITTRRTQRKKRVLAFIRFLPKIRTQHLQCRGLSYAKLLSD